MLDSLAANVLRPVTTGYARMQNRLEVCQSKYFPPTQIPCICVPTLTIHLVLSAFYDC